jgi:hypothetical protein
LNFSCHQGCDFSLQTWTKGVDATSHTVSHITIMSIDSKMHAGASQFKSLANKGDLRKLLVSLWSQTFWNSNAYPYSSVDWPCHAAVQFFHFQCMQSMLPSNLVQPLILLVARRLAVSTRPIDASIRPTIEITLLQYPPKSIQAKVWCRYLPSGGRTSVNPCVFAILIRRWLTIPYPMLFSRYPL